MSMNMKVVEHFFRKIDRKVVKGKDAYLLNELLKDCLEISEEIWLEESPACLRHTYRIKETLISHFGLKSNFLTLESMLLCIPVMLTRSHILMQH